MLFSKTIPVIGTCPRTVQCLVQDGKRWIVHDGETQQMNSRITYVPLRTSIPDGQVVECAECKRCAAELYLTGRPAGR